jgi:pimeloyl-ACP methyl ester carboxylesterase
MKKMLLISLLVSLARLSSEEPVEALKKLRSAISEVDVSSTLPTDLVVRSNLALARLRARKAELYLTPKKYRGDVSSMASHEIRMGFDALKNLKNGKVAYAGEKGGFKWPYGGGRTYYEYGMDSVNDGSPQPFLAEVPPNYNPAKKWPVLLYLHGYHGRVDMINKWDSGAVAKDSRELGYLVLAPHGRSETDFLCVGETDVLQAFEEFKRYYNVDEDRVYLIGGSMGGYGGLNLAFHYPHLWAAVAAFTASGDMMVFGGLPREKLLPFRRWSFEWDNPLDLCGNVPQLPITGTYGDADRWVPPKFGKAISERRTSLGGKYEYTVVPGIGHQVGNAGPAYRKAMEWFEGKKRNLWPKFVRHKTYSLRYDRSFWIRILDIAQWGESAEIEATVNGNTIEVKKTNLEGFEITFSAELVDLTKPIRVTVNGEQRFMGEVGKSRNIVIRKEEAAAERQHHLRKSTNLCGPFEDIFNHPFLVVRGTTAKDAARKNRVSQDADWFKKRWEAWTDGWPRMKDDVDVTDDDIKNFSLLLLGRPSENVLTAKVAPDLPIQFEGNDFVFDGRTHSGGDVGLCMIRPNPLNSLRYVAIMAGARYGLRMPENHPFSQLPDYMIFRAKPVQTPEEGRSGVFGMPDQHLVAGFFDSGWNVDKKARWEADQSGR